MLILDLFSLLFFVVKTDSKLTLHHMGKIFIIKFTKIKLKIWRVTFFFFKFTTEKLWDGLPVFQKYSGNITCRCFLDDM